MHLGHDRLTGEPLFFEGTPSGTPSSARAPFATAAATAGAARGILAAMGGLTKARLDRRWLGSGRFEPPGCRLRWADSLRTEHHAQLKEILRAVGCCDGREEGNDARNNVPPLPAAVDGTDHFPRHLLSFKSVPF